MGDTENLRNPSTKTQPYYLSHSYSLPTAISVLLAQPACYGTRSVRNQLFHPFNVVAFLDYTHLIRNLYRYFKPYTRRLIVPHPAPFHHIHHLPALHYPAPPCLHTPDIHGLEQPFRHTRTQPILLLSIQTKPRICSSSKPSRSTL